MNENDLLALKSKIIDTALPLLSDQGGTHEEKLDFLLNIIRGGNAGQNVFTLAFDVANSIEDPQAKLRALMQLLQEIDVRIDESDEQSAESQE